VRSKWNIKSALVASFLGELNWQQKAWIGSRQQASHRVEVLVRANSSSVPQKPAKAYSLERRRFIIQQSHFMDSSTIASTSFLASLEWEAREVHQPVAGGWVNNLEVRAALALSPRHPPKK